MADTSILDELEQIKQAKAKETKLGKLIADNPGLDDQLRLAFQAGHSGQTIAEWLKSKYGEAAPTSTLVLRWWRAQ